MYSKVTSCGPGVFMYSFSIQINTGTLPVLAAVIAGYALNAAYCRLHGGLCKYRE